MMDVMTRSVQWGVMATGRIAAKFAADLALVPGNELAAVGSRTEGAARDFAERFGARKSHQGYAELAADPDVEVVYVATPHGRHAQDVMLCLDAGKAVLCEKALTLDADSSAHLIAEARSRGLFLAEAMWMRCNPNIRALKRLVDDGAIGTVGQVRAELGFIADPTMARLWDPALGASALLDVGIYPLTLAHLVLGEPTGIAAAAVLSDRGIDLGGGATLTYPGGAVASIAWTQTAHSDNRASVAGDGGRIEVPARFHEASGLVLTRGDEQQEISEPVTGVGYAHEIEEVAACLRDGRTESATLPLDETIAIMRQMDAIRAQFSA